jgi:GNAT superfamily N-acetyltransferase
MTVFIRNAEEPDIPHLAGIERAAGELFHDVGMPEIAGDDPLPDDVLRLAAEEGLLWVAVEDAHGSRPVAYLMAKALDQSIHIEQVTVHPDHARQGIGSQLIDTCEAWAVTHGFSALTLTAFRDVPWNGPYYQRLGFVEVAPGDVSYDLADVVRHEHKAGLDRWPRVAMRRACPR